jgi:thioredoxin reductase
VLVADREAAPGGVPRHSAHTGYGLRDLRRVMTGPSYARALAGAAEAAGADVRPGTTVTGLASGPGGSQLVTMTSAGGIETVPAAAVLLATGCRERPRAARLVPGDRPAGVMTTGELQQRVYLGGERLAGRALVVGAEHVSFSAAVTLAHAGADVVALVTGHERQQSYAAFRLGAAVRWRIPVWTGSTVSRITGSRITGSRITGSRITGRGRLAGAEVTDLRTGATRFVPCETVVFTGDWIPDHELARRAGVTLDPGTRGPAVDTALATSVPGVFAAGNLVHAAETADIAALSGRHAARQIVAFLNGGVPNGGVLKGGVLNGEVLAGEPGRNRVPVLAEAPLRWISPNVIGSAAAPPLGRFVLRSREFRRGARLEAWQGGRLLARSRPVRLIPERPAHLDAGWLDQVDPAGGPVRVVTSS